MTVLHEGRHPAEFILSEANGQRSRDAVKIGASQDFEPNTVIAKRAVVSGVVATASAGAGNTVGSGALTLANPAVSSKVKDGVYQVVCIEPASNAGAFEVFDPLGVSIGKATVGVAFDKEVKFTIADATDFVAGDRFAIAVAADAIDFEWVAFNHDGTDGSEVPAGIAIYGAKTGVGESTRIAAVVRAAEVNGHFLIWPEDIDAAEKANAYQSLEGLGIIVRD